MEEETVVVSSTKGYFSQQEVTAGISAVASSAGEPPAL